MKKKNTTCFCKMPSPNMGCQLCLTLSEGMIEAEMQLGSASFQSIIPTVSIRHVVGKRLWEAETKMGKGFVERWGGWREAGGGQASNSTSLAGRAEGGGERRGWVI